MEMAGNGWNGLKWLEIAGHGWKLLEITRTGWNWLEMEERLEIGSNDHDNA